MQCATITPRGLVCLWLLESHFGDVVYDSSHANVEELTVSNFRYWYGAGGLEDQIGRWYGCHRQLR